MHQMMYQVSDISAKVSSSVYHKSSLLYVTHLMFDYPLPLLLHYFLWKKKKQKQSKQKKNPKNEQTEKPTGRTMFAPDHTLTSSLCVSASSADTKTFNASLLTTCTWLKSQHTILWSLLCYSFASLQWQWISVPLDYWKLQRTRGIFCRKQWCFGEKKKERH